MSPLLVPALLLSLLLPSAEFGEDRAELDATLATELEEAATHFDELRLRGARDRCYRALLVVAPDHEEARKALKYRQQRDGSWEQSGSYREPKDREEELLAESIHRYEEPLAEHRAAVVALLEQYSKTMPLRDRDEELQRLVELAPESAEARALVGEVRQGEDWILVESARALERRREIASAVERAFSQVPELVEVEAEGDEVAWGLDWTAGVRTDRIRVFGTMERAEIDRIASVVHASQDVFEFITGKAKPLPERFKLYVLPAHGERAKLLEAIGTFPGNQRQVLERAANGWLGFDQRFGEWGAKRPLRVDASARQAVGRMMHIGLDIGLDRAWAYEGFGLYMVEALVGTRLTWNIQQGRYTTDGSEAAGDKIDLTNAKSNWMALGLEVFSGGQPPSLIAIFGRKVSEMSGRDLLVAYVLAAYLAEGWPDQVGDILERVGKGEQPVFVFETELDHSLPTITSRLVRWLEETVDPEE